ncbi:MAG: hypothetical protein HWD89_10915 [Tenacibaculum sp.]|nr:MULTISPECIES: hypothetical protein [Tenacibaculum]NVK09557.1 hypothetical protein [Tenacibaculum sp.]
MLKNISSLGTTLNKKEQATINGAYDPPIQCPSENRPCKTGRCDQAGFCY